MLVRQAAAEVFVGDLTSDFAHVRTAETSTRRLRVCQSQQDVSTLGVSKKPVGYNADDFPSNPVPVDHRQCENSQTFAATSAQPSTGNSTCVGLTMAFGPMGDLKPYLDRVTQDRGRRQVGAQARQEVDLRQASERQVPERDGQTAGKDEAVTGNARIARLSAGNSLL